MNKKNLLISIVTLALVALACNFNLQLQGEPTDTPLPLATLTLTSTSPFAWPSGTGDCTLITATSQVAYDRPSSGASTFGDTGAAFEATVYVRTSDGWVGFSPGVPQAANIGIFRARWLHFDQVSLSGDCVSAPEAAWVPEPDVCYDMPMETVQVYSEADTSSAILATLEIEDFAAVIGLTGSGWVQVDLGAGNTGLSGIGWVEESTLNWNGSTCDELPTVSP